ncbi:hypothetical protein EGR_02131 [Echinococcus granulosus]|uniref:Uncharacterized protein n=1 Tax=Echinococcus granulosus TaxID=6210 RepID=W6UX04_ECHGR|nr:hypothetical protein EGR_02131 [Echinococcus granulosus]EUB63037.1 hypothetical protein EGR_02131 [Echinococcus granulosus]
MLTQELRIGITKAAAKQPTLVEGGRYSGFRHFNPLKVVATTSLRYLLTCNKTSAMGLYSSNSLRNSDIPLDRRRSQALLLLKRIEIQRNLTLAAVSSTAGDRDTNSVGAHSSSLALAEGEASHVVIGSAVCHFKPECVEKKCITRLGGL